MRGHYSTTQLLIQMSSNVVQDNQVFLRFKDVDGNTALHNAVSAPCYNERLFHLLLYRDLEHGPNPPNNIGESVLFIAAEQCKPGVVTKILYWCPSSSHSGPNGRNALHAAIISLDIESIEFICTWKSSLTKEADAYGWSPIHYAAHLGESSIFKLLLGMDISLVSVVNGNGDTPIHIAASKGWLNIIEDLLSYNPACRDCRNNKQQNILHVALENEQLKVVEYLSKNKLFRSIIYQKDSDGNTPLHLAAQNPKSNLFNHVDITDMEAKVFNHNNVTRKEIFYGAKLEPFGIGWRNDFMMHKPEKQAPKVQNFDIGYGKKANTRFIVSSVIAAVTFAAGFTVAGGLDSKSGHPVLGEQALFQIFAVSDTIALIRSLLAMFILMLSFTHRILCRSLFLQSQHAGW